MHTHTSFITDEQKLCHSLALTPGRFLGLTDFEKAKYCLLPSINVQGLKGKLETSPHPEGNQSLFPRV